MTDQDRHYHHGQSPAAWVTITIVGLGCLIGAVGAVLGPNWTTVVVGCVLLLLGPIVGGFMKAAGKGNG